MSEWLAWEDFPEAKKFRSFGLQKEDLPDDLRKAIDLAEEVEKLTDIFIAFHTLDYLTQWRPVGFPDDRVMPRKRWLATLRKILTSLDPPPPDPSVYICFQQLMLRLDTTERVTRKLQKTRGFPAPTVNAWQKAWHSIAPTLIEAAFWADRYRRGALNPGDDGAWLRLCVEWRAFADRSEALITGKPVLKLGSLA